MSKVKAKIKEIKAREIINSAGRPTLEVTIISDKNTSASVAYPFDNYVSAFSANCKLDGDVNRFKGLGHLKSVSIVLDQVAPELKDFDIYQQEELDNLLKKLNGDKNILGPAVIYCVSLANAKLAAMSSGQELFAYIVKLYGLNKPKADKLPVPLINIFNGGDTGDTNLDFQEFLLIPKRDKVSEMIRKSSEVFLELAEVLEEAGLDTDTGQEGGYAPEIYSSIEALEFMLSAIIRSGYEPGSDFNLGVDIGSSILYDQEEKKYIFSLDRNYFSAMDMTALYEEWLSRYPIVYLEDAFNENDWDSWKSLTINMGDKLILAGDDIVSSNINRLRELLNKNTFNTVILKPAKAGTLTDAYKYAKLAQERGYKLALCGLNQETDDNSLADLAVAFGAQYFKGGSLARGERVMKYNRLTEIAEKL